MSLFVPIYASRIEPTLQQKLIIQSRFYSADSDSSNFIVSLTMGQCVSSCSTETTDSVHRIDDGSERRPTSLVPVQIETNSTRKYQVSVDLDSLSDHKVCISVHLREDNASLPPPPERKAWKQTKIATNDMGILQPNEKYYKDIYFTVSAP